MSNVELGKKGEAIALAFLEAKGYKMLEMNWRIDHFEVDLILISEDQIVFVEVKYRTSDDYGDPSEAVHYNKRRNLIKAAHLYLVKNHIGLDPRFDIVAITEKENASPNIIHFEEAFYPIAR